MNYSLQLQQLRQQFEKTFNFYILRNNYGYSDSAKEFLDVYKSIIVNTLYDDKYKFERLQEHLKNNMSATLNTMPDIKKINSLWLPDFESIKQKHEFYEVDLPDRSKTICESIKQLFENSSIRSKIEQSDLYNLYAGYYQISSAINNKTLTNDILLNIEERVRNISNKVWSNSITNPNEFVSGEPFMFIVHNFSRTDVTDTTKLNEGNGRNGRVSTSLITDKEMGVFGSHKYGFIYTDISKIITAGKKDLYSYETEKEGAFTQDSKHSPLMTPQEIEKYLIEATISQNGQTLNSDNFAIYNEIILDSNGLKPDGIYCITFGEEELNEDYVNAKKLAENVGLPLIEIDISLYRTKDNKGTYLTDREPLTKREQLKFAEDFLKQYYGTKISDYAQQQNFVRSDLQLYQDMIVDIFLDAKRNGRDISKESLFREFEKKRELQVNRAQQFNEYTNESKKLIEAVNNLNKALETCTNESIRVQIENELFDLSKRLKAQNKLAENSNNLELSPDNWIYQTNSVSKDVMASFTPYQTERVVIGNDTIDVIVGYMSAEEIEQEKNRMLEQASKNTNIEERLEHAQRVIEVKCNSYFANSTRAKMQYYDQKREDLEDLVDRTKIYADITSLDSELSNYDELAKSQMDLRQQINQIQENLDLLSNTSQIEWIEKRQKDSQAQIDSLNDIIKQREEELRTLKSEQVNLEYEKSKLEKNFFTKLTNSSKISELEVKITQIKNQIESAEFEVENTKSRIENERSTTEMIIQSNSLLKSLNEKGLTLEDAKQRIKNLPSNSDEMIHQITQLETRLYSVENAMSTMRINAQNQHQARQTLESKKQQVGLSAENKMMIQENEYGMQEDMSSAKTI